MNYRPDIDGLRALAVIPVVIYHAGFPGPSGGFIGVDVFFVISGFLITSIVAREISQGGFSLILFYERRARRILPALMGVVLASFAIGWSLLLPAEMKSLGQSAFATSLFLSNVYFSLTLDYFAQAAEFAPLLHTWSLAVEEQFYLFFPPLLAVLLGRRWRRPLWIVVGLSSLSFVAAVILLPSKPEWVFYQIPFRAWELGAGAMLALTSCPPPQKRGEREVLAIVGLFAIVIPVFLFDSSTPFPAAAALPPVFGATILIWIGAQGGGSMVSTFLAGRALVWVGLISYSLYLWHWPILAFLRIAFETAILPKAIATCAVLASIAMAWLSYRFIEIPFRVRRSEGLGARNIFGASALSLATVAGFGWMLHASEGLPARLPAAVTAIAAFAGDGNDRREECFKRVPSEGLCTIGTSRSEEDRVDFLFWGDSHADAFMPGVDRAAGLNDRKGVFAGYSACPPIFSIQIVPLGQSCANFNESVWSWVNGRADVQQVILGARWSFWAEGTRYRGEAGQDVRLEWVASSEAHTEKLDNAAIFEASLNATVARIIATGRNVVLLGPVPEIGRNVPVASARQKLMGWTAPASVTRNDFEARSGRTERILMRVASAHEGVRYLPLSDLFCDLTQCQIESAKGRPLYIDDDHISKTTALDLLPERLKEIWQ